jgi:hypothetical protein
MVSKKRNQAFFDFYKTGLTEFNKMSYLSLFRLNILKAKYNAANSNIKNPIEKRDSENLESWGG